MRRARGRARCGSADTLRQRFYPMQKMFLALPERNDFSFVFGSTGLLQAVDFPLQGGALPVVPQALECAHTVGRVGRGPRWRAISATSGGLSCT